MTNTYERKANLLRRQETIEGNTFYLNISLAKSAGDTVIYSNLGYIPKGKICGITLCSEYKIVNGLNKKQIQKIMTAQHKKLRKMYK